MRGGPVSVIGNRFVKRSYTEKIHLWDIDNLYGTLICQ